MLKKFLFRVYLITLVVTINDAAKAGKYTNEFEDFVQNLGRHMQPWACDYEYQNSTYYSTYHNNQKEIGKSEGPYGTTKHYATFETKQDHENDKIYKCRNCGQIKTWTINKISQNYSHTAVNPQYGKGMHPPMVTFEKNDKYHTMRLKEPWNGAGWSEPCSNAFKNLHLPVNMQLIWDRADNPHGSLCNMLSSMWKAARQLDEHEEIPLFTIDTGNDEPKNNLLVPFNNQPVNKIIYNIVVEPQMRESCCTCNLL